MNRLPYVQVEDLNIYYKIEGSGPPLVLLHGMSNNSRSWEKQVEDLKKNYTVIAWDAPGYGNSSDPIKEFTQFQDFAVVLKGFLDKLNLKEIYLLGHSMGAATALEFYRLYPNFIKALILADITRGAAALSSEENESKLKNRLYAIGNFSPQEIANQRIKALLSSGASKEVFHQVKEIMSMVRPAGYRSVANSLYNLDQMDLLPRVNVPTLIICGELDSVTPVKESTIIHKGIRESELVIVPKTGHLCYQEDPHTFNIHIHEFLNKFSKVRQGGDGISGTRGKG